MFKLLIEFFYNILINWLGISKTELAIYILSDIIKNYNLINNNEEIDDENQLIQKKIILTLIKILKRKIMNYLKISTKKIFEKTVIIITLNYSICIEFKSSKLLFRTNW